MKSQLGITGLYQKKKKRENSESLAVLRNTVENKKMLNSNYNSESNLSFHLEYYMTEKSWVVTVSIEAVLYFVLPVYIIILFMPFVCYAYIHAVFPFHGSVRTWAIITHDI